MCLPDFIEFKEIDKSSPLIGYRSWKNLIKDSLILKSQIRNYEWSKIEGPHEIKQENSGIYAYNNYYNYNNNNNYYNNYNNYYYYYNNYLVGIINQWGKTAIHEDGQRSEYVKIDTLFNIKELDVKGPKKFIDWIKIFNKRINLIAENYECKVISWQDFLEINKT